MSDWPPDKIRALRTRLGWSQADLAEYLRLPTYDGSAPRVADLESGRRDPSGPVTKLLDHLEAQAEAGDPPTPTAEGAPGGVR